MIGAVIVASETASHGGNGNGGGQLQLLSPTSVLELALKPFLQQSLSPVVLVLGKDYHRVLNVLKTPKDVKIVIHRRPERGFASAVSVGLQAVPPEVTGVFIARGSHLLEARILEKLSLKFEASKGEKKIVVASYHGKKGFPWIISSNLKKEIARFEEDLTLSSFLKAHRKEVQEVDVG